MSAPSIERGRVCGIKKNPAVERWFDETNPPAANSMRRVREVILRADPRVSEYVKYGTLTFA